MRSVVSFVGPSSAESADSRRTVELGTSANSDQPMCRNDRRMPTAACLIRNSHLSPIADPFIASILDTTAITAMLASLPRRWWMRTRSPMRSCDDASVVVDRRAQVIGVTCAIALVAVAAAAGGMWWTPPDGVIDRNAAALRAVLGGLAGLALAVVGLAVIARRAPAADRVPPALLLSLATIAIAVGMLVGSATAPRRAVLEVPEDKAPAPARLVDADGDGRPDTDPQGEQIVAVDGDRDGRFETRLTSCQGASTVPPSSAGLEVDVSCDGTGGERTIVLQSALLVEVVPEPWREEDGGANRFVVTLLVVVALLGLVLLLGRNRPRREDEGPDLPRGSWLPPAAPHALAPEAVDAALGSSLEALVGDPDPRVGVRAAYAVLLDALAEVGADRRAYETPDEHLTRSLGQLAIDPEPLRVLFDLFSLARFSSHEITELHRTEAVTALRAAKDSLHAHAARTLMAEETSVLP